MCEFYNKDSDDIDGVDFSGVSTNDLVWVGNILVELSGFRLDEFNSMTGESMARLVVAASRNKPRKIEALELAQLIDSLYDESAFNVRPDLNDVFNPDEYPE